MALNLLRALAIGVTAIAGCAIAAPAAAPGFAALGALEKGEWELRTRGGRDVRRICISDTSQLLQIRHPRHNCARYVITDTPTKLVVTYSCGGAGSGRTDLRVETSRLVQIQSQGIADAAPFSFSVEARRTGSCR